MHEQEEIIIDLCTPTLDTTDISILPVVVENTSTSAMITDQFPNLRHRLSILPCYPTNNADDQVDPLLPNIPRM